MESLNDFMLFDMNTSPVIPLFIIVRAPHRLLTITYSPKSIASFTTAPHPSCNEGKRVHHFLHD